jgi:hypothetical protein
MKKIAIFIAAWICFTASNGQTKTEKHINFSGKESLALDLQIADSIDIQSWDRNEVYVTASVNINDNKENDAYLISFSDSGSDVEVNANFKKEYFKGKNNCCTTSDIRWKVFIPEKIPISVETINGNITITGRTGEMKIKSISGFIDLAVPASKPADIEFSTISGTVFTDHKLAMEARSKGIPSVIREKLNNGGPPIKLETISGDIFFRKSE